MEYDTGVRWLVRKRWRAPEKDGGVIVLEYRISFFAGEL